LIKMAVDEKEMDLCLAGENIREKMEVVKIDGSFGEGGGQILRTALSLSAVTGKPFHIVNIRKNRKNPGLGSQHLAAVTAAGKVCRARMEGHVLRSRELFFNPGSIVSGDYRFEVATAGSVLLVFQTVLPILALGGKESRLELMGGTHNPWAPPYDFVKESFVPLLSFMGLKVDLALHRYGFYPRGGGKMAAVIAPFSKEARFMEFVEKGEAGPVSAEVLISGLPISIAEREVSTIRQRLGRVLGDTTITEIPDAPGPGNVVMIRAVYGKLTHLFAAFGVKGKRAESVAMEACEQFQRFQNSEAALDEHLANQVLLYLALRSGGVLSVPSISLHTATNLEIIKLFLQTKITVEKERNNLVRINIEPFQGMSKASLDI
jgi:RNA 3'-terminal phosphate cyclase (ATP)